MIRLIFAAVLIGVIWWYLRKLRKLPAKEQKKAYWNVAVAALIAITLFAVFTGRMHWLGGVIAGVFALGKMGIRYLPLIKFLGKNNVFGNPTFNTPHLKAQVDLQTGDVTGEVLAGPMEGKNIADLTNEELAELRSYYKDKDKRAYYLVYVVMQRRNTQAHSQSNGQAGQKTFVDAGNLAVSEAVQILGLEDNYSKDDVIAAHRRLIQKLHPDRGGNDYLASQVNLAKDTLLKHLG